jgi:hypothetical protein
LTRPGIAPVLEHLPGVSGVLHRQIDEDLELHMRMQLSSQDLKARQRRRPPDAALERLIRDTRPDALLNFYSHDLKIVEAASRASVPAIVARPRGWRQFLEVTHYVLKTHNDSSRDQSQHNLDFLGAYRWPVPESIPPPRLVLTQEEAGRGLADMAGVPAPRLGLVVKGFSGPAPSPGWWEKMIDVSRNAGWNPVILSPLDTAALPPTDLRGLMARLRACDAVLGTSTGPTHLAAALGVPTLCLMGRHAFHTPARWAPLGRRTGTLQYEGEEDDWGTGMDQFSPDTVLARLDGLR